MKQELLKKINPIIEKCVDDILASFESIEVIRIEAQHQKSLYEGLISEKEKELSQIKELRTKQKKEHDEKITGLSCAQEDLFSKIEMYEGLTREVENQKKSIESDVEAAHLDLLRAKETKAQAENVKQEAEKFKRDFEAKIFSLKGDFEKIDKADDRIKEDDKKLKRERHDLDKKEAKLNMQQKELNDQELRVKTERKEVNRLVERYHLKDKLKGG